jgi:gliotoxin/aspirochlorine biosynthesis aminotransferase
MLSQRGKSESKWFLREFERQLKRQKGDGNPMVDMSTAENWPIRNKVLPILKAITRKSLAYDHLSYASGLGGSKELLATTSNFFNHFFSPKHRVTPEHLVSGAGCSAVLASLIYETCDWGDGLLVEAPYWGKFMTQNQLVVDCCQLTELFQ